MTNVGSAREISCLVDRGGGGDRHVDRGVCERSLAVVRCLFRERRQAHLKGESAQKKRRGWTLCKGKCCKKAQKDAWWVGEMGGCVVGGWAVCVQFLFVYWGVLPHNKFFFGERRGALHKRQGGSERTAETHRLFASASGAVRGL